MIKTINVIFLSALLGGFIVAQDPEKIRQVENGLLKDIQIESTQPMNLLARMKELGAPGVSIAVVQNGQVAWAKGYGVRDLTGGEPVTPDTLFQAASITKSITAVVALRLVQEGRLDLDRDVNSYLKRWKLPENEFTRTEKVTIRRILNHTAGLTVRGLRGYAEGETVPTIERVLDGLPPANNAPVRVDKVPGGSYRYSGGGFTLLQCLIEDVTGHPLFELARDLIFEPAGMTRSTICLCPPSAAHLAKETAMGHTLENSGKLLAFKGYTFLQGGSGCCELWTTPTDLARFVIAIQKSLRGYADAILSRDMARAMLAVGKEETSGLGFVLNRQDGANLFGHDGGNAGFVSRFMGDAEQGTGFAVMVNSDNAQSLPSEITYAIRDVYGWKGSKPTLYKDASAIVTEARQALERNPADAKFSSEQGLNSRGYGLLGMGYLEAAVGTFQLNVELHPQSANACDSLAEALERSGDAARALAMYRQALRLLDQYPDINKNFANNRKILEDKIHKLEGEKSALKK